jgi:REP element-mobilizing transposase RayT
MSEKFQNKYTIKSTRLENYDYSQNGLYFVTICTKDREELFGKIVNEKMFLNDVGKIVNQFWQEIPKHFPFVNLDEFILMPNHMHGIIEILKNPIVETHFNASKTNITSKINDASGVNIVQGKQGAVMFQDGIARKDALTCQDALKCVSTENNKQPGGVTGLKNPSLNPGALSNIIKLYKGRCAFEIRKQLSPITFAWQPKFYDHIIRDNESLNKIREYVIKNPEMWERDRNNVENVFM